MHRDSLTPVRSRGALDAAPRVEEEDLIVDHRASLRPAQCVEQKLADALRSAPLLVSQLQGLNRPYGR